MNRIAAVVACLIGSVFAIGEQLAGAAREGGGAEDESGFHPDRQPGGVDARLLRQSGHSHAAYRPAGGGGDSVHAGAEQQSGVLADAGDVS